MTSFHILLNLNLLICFNKNNLEKITLKITLLKNVKYKCKNIIYLYSNLDLNIKVITFYKVLNMNFNKNKQIKITKKSNNTKSLLF